MLLPLLPWVAVLTPPRLQHLLLGSATGTLWLCLGSDAPCRAVWGQALFSLPCNLLPYPYLPALLGLTYWALD